MRHEFQTERDHPVFINVWKQTPPDKDMLSQNLIALLAWKRGSKFQRAISVKTYTKKEHNMTLMSWKGSGGDLTQARKGEQAV